MNLSTSRPIRASFLLLSLIAWVSCAGWAQNVGSLQGQVTDPTGAVIVKANVEVTDNATGVTRTTQTDTEGSYSFSQLPPGSYKVIVSMTGFKTIMQDKVAILVATPTTLNLRLQVGTMSQQVTVEGAAAPALNTTDATIGNAFDETQIKSLPFLARNVVNLLTLEPGVVFTGMSDTDLLSMGTNQSLDTREGSVDGIRGNQTNVTVDGADSNDWQNQSPFTSALPVTLDSVQEFRVTTTNANATDGLVGGPQVALVTKSGSNAFHGNVRWYYRTSGATANQFFNNQVGIPRAKLQRQIPGGSLGGPILKNRFFFFLDTEERREASSEPVAPRSIPSDALRDGVLVYSCATPSQCPGGPVQGLTALQTIPAGTFGLTPAQFKSLDPAGVGVNPAMITVLNFFPHGNDCPASNDNCLSFSALEFNSPIIRKTAVQTARIDYNITKDGRHSIFWRGTLGDYNVDLTDAQYPGQPAASKLLNNSKGFVVQYQGQLSSNLTETARYSLTRLGVEQTGTQGTSFRLRSFDNLSAFARDTSHRVPVHEIADDVTYNHGAHTFQMGASLEFVRNSRIDFGNSFPDYLTNDGFCVSLCNDMVNEINGGSTFPAVGDPGFFRRAMMALTGSITQVSATFLADPKSGTVLQPGSPALREFAENAVGIYAQDIWKARPNLTVTFGLRWGYETPPWEVNGVEVTPTQDIMQWFQERVKNMNAGIPSSASPLLSWGLAGKANSKPSWYNPQYKNFSPRLAVAYSPSFSEGIGKALFGGAGKSSIRLGAGLDFDRIGQALAVDSDLSGSPGTATSLIDGSQQFNLTSAPRFSGSCTAQGVCTGLPPLSNFLSGIPTTATFPFTPVANASNLGFAIDQNLKTPYSIHLDASFERELPRKIVLDVSYVGTLGRRLLGKTDFAQYLDIRDPKSSTDLWSAYQQIVRLANVTPSAGITGIEPSNLAQLATIKSIPFFDNMLPNMPAFADSFFPGNGYAGLTPTQAFYAYALSDTAGGASWSCALFPMDTGVGGSSGLPSPWNTTVDPNGTGFVLFSPQFSSLPGWTNFANSNFHSLQVSVRRTVGIATVGFNYVLSHSIDNASGAENGDLIPGTNGTLNALIQNPFNLRAGRASSDFDLRHDFNGNWIVDLPIGRGRRYFSNVGHAMNALVGGWEITGLARWRSGFPESPGNGFNFPTNFFLTTPGTVVAQVGTHVVRNVTGSSSECSLISCGTPNLFSNPVTALNAVGFTLPGLSGSRNVWSGPAYFDMDAGVTKNILMPWSDTQRLQLRATAYNVFNGVNFADSQSLDPTAPNTFGEFIATAGPRGAPREMEFSARFEF